MRLDHGPELTAGTFVDWCQRPGIALRYIQPDKPDRNACIERFNRSYREEVLSAYAFESIEQVRVLTDDCCGPTTKNAPATASAVCRC